VASAYGGLKKGDGSLSFLSWEVDIFIYKKKGEEED
jgi:hypothetical protein